MMTRRPRAKRALKYGAPISKRWEDLKMTAGEDKAMQEALKELYKYNTEEQIREQCEARERYYFRKQYMENKIYTLTEKLKAKDEQIAAKDEALATNAKELAAKDEEIALLRQELAKKNSV